MMSSPTLSPFPFTPAAPAEQLAAAENSAADFAALFDLAYSAAVPTVIGNETSSDVDVTPGNAVAVEALADLPDAALIVDLAPPTGRDPFQTQPLAAAATARGVQVAESFSSAADALPPAKPADKPVAKPGEEPLEKPAEPDEDAPAKFAVTASAAPVNLAAPVVAVQPPPNIPAPRSDSANHSLKLQPEFAPERSATQLELEPPPSTLNRVDSASQRAGAPAASGLTGSLEQPLADAPPAPVTTDVFATSEPRRAGRLATNTVDTVVAALPPQPAASTAVSTSAAALELAPRHNPTNRPTAAPLRRFVAEANSATAEDERPRVDSAPALPGSARHIAEPAVETAFEPAVAQPVSNREFSEAAQPPATTHNDVPVEQRQVAAPIVVELDAPPPSDAGARLTQTFGLELEPPLAAAAPAEWIEARRSPAAPQLFSVFEETLLATRRAHPRADGFPVMRLSLNTLFFKTLLAAPVLAEHSAPVPDQHGVAELAGEARVRPAFELNGPPAAAAALTEAVRELFVARLLAQQTTPAEPPPLMRTSVGILTPATPAAARAATPNESDGNNDGQQTADKAAESASPFSLLDRAAQPSVRPAAELAGTADETPEQAAQAVAKLKPASPEKVDQTNVAWVAPPLRGTPVAQATGTRDAGDGHVAGQLAETLITASEQLPPNEPRTLRLKLRPKELGQVEVELKYDAAGRFTARLTVEREQTTQVLRNELGQLRAALEQAGLQVGQLDITTSPNSHGQGWHAGGQARHYDPAFLARVPDPEPVDYEPTLSDGASSAPDRLINLHA